MREVVMCGTTRDLTQARTSFGSGHVAPQTGQAEPRSDWRKPPARYEAAAIGIMLFIVALMPLFSR